MTDSAPLATPFRGVRFADTATLSALVAPPYDVISAEHRRRLVAADPNNVVRFILPESDGDRYRDAATLFQAWLADGTLTVDPQESVTVVRQTFRANDGQEYRRTGVIAAVAAEAFEGGRVRPHERTHKGPKEDRLALLRASAFIFESLLMFAPDRDRALHDRLQEVLKTKPSAQARLDEVDVAVWKVDGGPARQIADLAGRSNLYIADGHHRYETAVAYRAEMPAADRIPALIVSLVDPGLVVEATHRLIVGEEPELTALEAQFRERFQIKELSPDDDAVEVLAYMRGRGTACAVVGSGARAFAMLLKGGDVLEDFATGLHQAVSSLDVLRVDEMVVKPLLAAAGEGARLEYTADARDAMRRVEDGRAACGVLLNPTPVDRVLAVADANEVMPQKSTYFYPKVPSGLVGLHYAHGRDATPGSR